MLFRKHHLALAEMELCKTALEQALNDQKHSYESRITELEGELEQLRRHEQSASQIANNQLRGAAVLQRIREGLADSANELIAESQALEHMEQIFHESQQAIGHLDQRSQTITAHAHASSQSASHLEQSAAQIRQLVSSIHSISDQTNLLALNAAIEAARAGEAGRGFAVVADEVRQLAKRAGEASASIDQLVTSIVSQVSDIQTTLQQTQQSVEEISSSSLQINGSVSTLITQSKHLKSIVKNHTTDAFLTTVKLDHSVWKNDVYKRINEQRLSEHLSCHTECRLGKWYFEGDGAAHFQHLPSFRALDRPHQEVHEQGRLALAAAANGDQAALNQHLLHMEQASEQVVGCIDRLQAEAIRL